MSFSIPCIINNFNRLTTTKKLADDLHKLGYTNIHILDNKSTYPPLLEWYSNCPYTVKRLEENHGPLSVYNSGYINEFINEPWIAYTDSDIELNINTPSNFIEYLISIAEKYNRTKVGLALRIDDLPANMYSEHYRSWESKYWATTVEPYVYEAQIDTTFAIIKPGLPFDYQALRIGSNFTAKHLPWYTQFDNLTEEEKYYLDHSNELSSYKRFYYNHIKTNKL